MTLLWAARLALLGFCLSSAVMLVGSLHSFVGGFLLGAWAMIEVYELVTWWTS